jgi:hypothetical protein
MLSRSGVKEDKATIVRVFNFVSITQLNFGGKFDELAITPISVMPAKAGI